MALQLFSHPSDVQTQSIVTLWNEILQSSDDIKASAKYMEQQSLFNDIARANNQVLIISNFKKHLFLTLSDNYDDFFQYGSSRENVIKYGGLYWFRSIPYSQIYATIRISNWYSGLIKKVRHNAFYNQSYAGWKFKSFDSGYKRILHTHSTGLEYDENGSPLIVLTIVKDITSLYREGADLWSRISFDPEGKTNYYYLTSQKNIQCTEILTPREKEFISQFANGLDLKEIAEQMQISYNTADVHRNNLLLKLGARNATAAVEICKMMGLKL